MAVDKPENPPAWRREAFDAMTAGWSTLRKKRDAHTLKKVFALAAHSPLMKEALDWAEKHDVAFFVDHKTDYVGYYTPGTGVLAVSPQALKHRQEAVDTIVHEIRHAWQDYNNLSERDVYSFSESFTRIALMEADANAFGDRARDEYRVSQMISSEKLETRLANEKTDLAERFLSWFLPESGYTAHYGADVVGYVSAHLAQSRSGNAGMNGEKPAGETSAVVEKIEFVAEATPLGGAIELDHVQDVMRLGMNFAGTANYMTALPPDALPRQVLKPSLADTFWGVATPEQKKLTTELRKDALRKKLAQPKVKHPWP